jgi:hypothetical protein
VGQDVAEVARFGRALPRVASHEDAILTDEEAAGVVGVSDVGIAHSDGAGHFAMGEAEVSSAFASFVQHDRKIRLLLVELGLLRIILCISDKNC